MNEERTFGIEMELHLTKKIIGNSSGSEFGRNSYRYQHDALARVINEAFLANDLFHRAEAEHWSQQINAHNFRKWVIKTDGSLSGSPFDTHPHGTELVSPVLKGREGLRVLAVVCKAVEPYVKVSKKCGLHVHHGLQAEELQPLICRWLKIEKVVLESLPSSRRDGNRYCKPLSSVFGGFGVDVPGERTDLREWYRTNCRDWGSGGGSRYTTMNIASFWLRGTVEFRCAAGTYEYDKIANWVLFTQSVVEKRQEPSLCIDNAEGLVSWITGSETSSTVSEEIVEEVEIPIDPLEEVMTNRIMPASNPALWFPGTGFMRARRGSMSADIDQCLVQGMWLSEIIERIAGNHNRNIAQARSKVLTHINFRRGEGVAVTQTDRGPRRNVRYQVFQPGTGPGPTPAYTMPRRPRTERRTRVVERQLLGSNVHLDQDYIDAVHWVKSRWEHFQRPARNREQVANGEQFTLF